MSKKKSYKPIIPNKDIDLSSSLITDEVKEQYSKARDEWCNVLGISRRQLDDIEYLEDVRDLERKFKKLKSELAKHKHTRKKVLRELVISLKDDGFTDSQISAKVGMSSVTVRNILNSLS